MPKHWNTGRFWSFVDKTDGCWNWKGSLSHGYGSCTWGGVCGAHRVAYKLAHGAIPPRAHVLHTCDNRRCVNPNHLWLGNGGDNAKDRHQKGRDKSGHLYGEFHGKAILTYEQVKEIRKRVKKGVTKAYLARTFHVSASCIQHVCSPNQDRSWKYGKGGKRIV